MRLSPEVDTETGPDGQNSDKMCLFVAAGGAGDAFGGGFGFVLGSAAPPGECHTNDNNNCNNILSVADLIFKPESVVRKW